MMRLGPGLAALCLPQAAHAHDAFGDLGPFYQALLHPLADPGQGLILAALAILLARQPVADVRIAYAAVLGGALLAVLLHLMMPGPATGLRASGLIVAGLGALAVTGLTLPAALTAPLAGAIAILAGFAGDAPDGARAAGLSAFGTLTGIALAVLLLWSALDALMARLGRVAGAVAGSWVAAIGLMAAALPPAAP